jgi:dTDP-4-dehydrorhamnose reductase
VAYDYPEIDFTVPSSLRRIVEDSQSQIVINAAAYTDVDKAESESEQAKLINTDAPSILAETCRGLGAAFIHYSTDYVFDGTKGTPYTEEDFPHPLNIYGRTKLAGEQAILKAGGVNLIFRTAWVYSLRRDSFVTKVLRWAHSQTEMHIVDDQVSNPTWARALADITAQLLAKAEPDPLAWLAERCGLYHLAGRGDASRFEWAKEILNYHEKKAPQLVINVHPACSADFPTPAARPNISALDCGKFEQIFNLQLPGWKDALRLAMEEEKATL